MINRYLAIIVLMILLFICCTQGAFAGASPYYDQSNYFIPDNTPYVNSSCENCTVTDEYPPIQK